MQELVEMLTANWVDPNRFNLIVTAMSAEQLDATFELMKAERSRRAQQSEQIE